MKKARVAALALAAACALLFAGCSDDNTDPPPSTTDTPGASTSEDTTPTETPDPVEWKPLTSLDQIMVSGTALGVEPEVSFDTPLRADTTLIATLVKGTGPAAHEDGIIGIFYAGYNTRDGEKFDGNYGDSPYMGYANGFIDGFTKALVGQTVGSRILVAITSADGYVEGRPTAGIEVGDTLVFVIDLVDGQYYEPTGTTVTDGNDYAIVNLDNEVPIPQSRPGVAAPTETVVTTLVKGVDARQVTATDYAVVNYVEVNYATGAVLSGSYGSNSVVAQLNTLISGWQKGLLGQSVGSRVLLVVPPADAYPDGDTARGLEPGQTLLYVVDILYVVSGTE
ncbi:MAG: FKBP-type peptidyl-prolyl cis-trans isomerase [Propionibacteriaceae bacterium]|nr:FKBP-type peptidyl-prolyl cis-trans isomerase [Propionibacteriaceae bacterium]